MKLSRSLQQEWRFFCLVLIFSAISFFPISDTPWGYPGQSYILHQAVQANQEGVLASLGISGSLSITYHPFTIWIYQLFLLLTKDIVNVIRLQHFLKLSLCFYGLVYLSRALSFNKIPIILYFLSLPGYLFSVEISDDNWLIPLSLYPFVAYVSFHKKNRLMPVIMAVLVLILLFYIHPRSLILSVPFIIVFCAFERHWKDRICGA